ncbi:MAG: isoprenylcysteine carboxylmethyltransferase family protein [Burkholderiales bacterium]|nr:isoprenylcysteine carboxylmethyltransferase family protein [Burkholderiales bacterium]
MSLELRIPPPVVGLIAAALMWGLAMLPPALAVPTGVRLALVAASVVAGLGFNLLGLVAFVRSRTTINPLHPGRTSALVTGGVYRVTRNPMYVGMALLLLAWAFHLSALWAFLGPALFVAYITRFQIVPEERVLRGKFDEFEAYASRVRRWL